MGFMDKLKNIFFEEEEDDDELEEVKPPKKEKEKLKDRLRREKKSEEDDDYEAKKEIKKEKLSDVIAKKVELPRRNKKNDFEDTEEKEITKEEVKTEEKVEVKKVEEKIQPKRETRVNTELIFDDDDFILDTKPKEKKEEKIVRQSPIYKTREEKYEVKKEEVKKEQPKPVYQTKKEEKTKVFKPSPIISPIYGILDKNYKKEEVKENTEIRLSTRPSRMDLDSIRNKAFGDLEYDLFENGVDEEVEEKEKEEKKVEKKDIRKIVTENEEKPSIEKVTIGEADEYYNDLGLAYNTDYKDLSKDLSDGKVTEKKKNDKLEDNLFDLIESMYDKEE